MLDVLIFKKKLGVSSSICWKPYTKPTARHLPLHPCSKHPRSTHMSWPIAECMRFVCTSFARGDFEIRKRAFVEKLRHHFFDSEIIQACINWKYPRVTGCFALQVQEQESRARVVRLVLPYCPFLSKSLARVIRQVHSPSLWSYLRMPEMNISISNATSGRNLMLEFRQLL